MFEGCPLGSLFSWKTFRYLCQILESCQLAHIHGKHSYIHITQLRDDHDQCLSPLKNFVSLNQIGHHTSLQPETKLVISQKYMINTKMTWK
jgi:hypothetical protein